MAAAVYLATLILSIGISAAYNIWPVSPFKWALRRFDHSAIFLLIAGTYTPFMVKAETWFHLAAVWTVAACGVVLKLLWSGRFDRLRRALLPRRSAGAASSPITRSSSGSTRRC